MGYPPAKILQLMRLYDDTCLALCEGQFMDIWTSEHDEWISVDYYFDMIGRKTASLIAGAIQAAAMLATEDAGIVAAYRGFGWALGLAFQLNDDLLGIWGDEAATGKEPSDIATRKKTLPRDLRHGARRARKIASGCARSSRPTTRPPQRWRRHSGSWSAPAPATTFASAPAATATRRWPSSNPSAWWTAWPWTASA